MESYVEVAFLHNGLTNVLSVWMALYLIQRPLCGWRVGLYALFSAAVGTLLFVSFAWLVVLIVEAVGFLFVFYRQKALYLVSLLIRMLWHATCFVFWEGSFHSGAFFPWIHTPIWLCWCLYVLLLLYLKGHAMTLLRQRYVYHFTLYGKSKLHLLGYMDSGNLLSWKHAPVIFIDARFREQFNGIAQPIEIASIHGRRTMPALPVKCAIKGCTTQQAYAVFVKGLCIRRNCRAILNLKLLSMR